MKNKKTYRGQRVQKSYKIGCGCFYCTGTNKEDVNKIKEKIAIKEIKKTLNEI